MAYEYELTNTINNTACECELLNIFEVEVTQDALLDVEIGGSAGVLLQAKSVDVTENGTSVVAPDDGFDGLKSVEIKTNVPKRFECGDAYFTPPASVTTFTKIVILLKTLNASCWDTSKVTSMSNLFSYCSSLQTLDVSGWDTSKVTDMSDMFYGCYSLQSIDVSGWDTSKVTSMNSVFRDCESLTSLYIDNWDVSNVTTLQNMFMTCKSLTSLYLNNWNTSNVKNMNGIFRNMVNLKMLNISNWDTSSVTNISYMFCGAKFLPKVDLSGWDASNVTNTFYMFYDTSSLYSIIGDKTIQDVENGTVALRGTKVNIDTLHSKLRFSSTLALTNGLADLTGGTAQTLNISARSYNMYNDDDTIPSTDVIAERQARIAAICAAKNWNFAH